MALILGSTSPRRKEILSYFKIPFTVASPDFDETQVPFQGDPKEFACQVAHRKALCLIDRFPNDVILTADTIVYRNGRLFLKPESLEEAHGMLSELQGKEHQVFTAVTVMGKNSCYIEAEETRVLFNQLTDDQIHRYHNRILPLDKAGGYAIQQAGSLIVKRIEGCYYNIMGLPIQTVDRLLRHVGINLWDYI